MRDSFMPPDLISRRAALPPQTTGITGCKPSPGYAEIKQTIEDCGGGPAGIGGQRGEHISSFRLGGDADLSSKFVAPHPRAAVDSPA